jgi:hypothetical protein
MGIRAVQAGALTDGFDELRATRPEMVDYRRATPFRTLAREIGESPAALAHRYALSIFGIATLVLGVKNRSELRECLVAADRGTLKLSHASTRRLEGLVDRLSFTYCERSSTRASFP